MTKQITTETLDNIEQLALAATPGRIFVDDGYCCEESVTYLSWGDYDVGELRHADAAFIVAANPETVLAMKAKILDLELTCRNLELANAEARKLIEAQHRLAPGEATESA